MSYLTDFFPLHFCIPSQFLVVCLVYLCILLLQMSMDLFYLFHSKIYFFQAQQVTDLLCDKH